MSPIVKFPIYLFSNTGNKKRKVEKNYLFSNNGIGIHKKIYLFQTIEISVNVKRNKKRKVEKIYIFQTMEIKKRKVEKIGIFQIMEIPFNMMRNKKRKVERISLFQAMEISANVMA